MERSLKVKIQNMDSSDCTGKNGAQNPDIDHRNQSTDEKDAITTGIYFCQVCGAATRSFCRSCCNAYYCGRKHQKVHWKVHKAECFPVQVIQDKDLGRILIATRNIKQGERFISEKPIFITPNTRSERGITCLGCCKKLSPEISVPCSGCEWAMCSIKCEMEHLHVANECKVFQQHQIESRWTTGNSYQTLCEIGVLRMLLIKSRDQDTWGKLAKLDDFSEARKNIPDNVFDVNKVIQFIREDCKMQDLSEGLIDMSFGILRGNAFDTSDYSGFIRCCSDDVRYASVIFPTAIIPGPSCIPNSHYSISGRDSGNFKISCFAALDIPKNEAISIPYEDDFTGTFIRHKVKKTVFFQNCKCAMCIDPTEMSSYLSSLKCLACKSGYLVSIHPLESDSEWKCENCSWVLNHSAMLEMLQLAKAELESCVNHSTLDESWKGLKELRNTKLHPNHFIILQTEMEFCRRIVAMIETHAELKNIASNLSNILDGLIDICRHLLSVANVLRPGYSRTRGRLLYCLQFGLLVSLLIEDTQEGFQGCILQAHAMGKTQTKKRYKNKRICELHAAQKEAELILALENDEYSEEHKMYQTLKGELKIAAATLD